jgi:hypothetical protein
MNSTLIPDRSTWRPSLAILPWFALACVLVFALILRWTPLGNKSYLSPLISSSSLFIAFSGILLIWIVARLLMISSSGVSFIRGAGTFIGLLLGEGVVAFIVCFIWIFLMLGSINPG